MPWCRFFVPKIASPDVKPGEPGINDHIMYAKCIKGHVLHDADDWLLCENLPAPGAKCWQEGGDTLFSLQIRKRAQTREANPTPARPETSNAKNTTATRVSKS